MQGLLSSSIDIPTPLKSHGGKMCCCCLVTEACWRHNIIHHATSSRSPLTVIYYHIKFVSMITKSSLHK